MAVVDITLQLPEELVSEARAAGVLTDKHVAELIVAELERKRRVDQLFDDIEKLHMIEPPFTQAEVDEEVRAYRQEKKARQQPKNGSPE